MRKIKIVDYYAIHTFHEIIDFSLLKICSQLFDHVSYVCGKSALKNMHNLIHKLGEDKVLENVSFSSISVCEVESSFGALVRTFCGFFFTLYHYISTPKDTIVLFNYTNSLSLPIILLFNRVAKKEVIFTFHGELELLLEKPSVLKPSALYKKMIECSFKSLFNGSPSFALVLGDSIKQNIVNLYPNMQPRIISIVHPYFLDNSHLTPKVWSKNMPLRIGTVGVMTEKKGLNEFIELSQKLNDLIKVQKVELISIGRVLSDKYQHVDTISWKGANTGLSRSDFENEISQLDFILYLYPIDSYRFTASGAIMDAVKLHKPIIALHNDYFDWLMGENSIGYMGHSISEIETIIRKLNSMELSATNFEKQFELIARKISISYNVRLFKEEYENCVEAYYHSR